MVTKKRLLFIIPTLRGAGAERVLIDILNRFDYNRYEVDLLLYDNKGELFEHVNDKVRTHVLYTKRRPKIPLIENRYTRNIFLFIRSLLALNPFIWYDTVISFLEGEGILLHNHVLNRRRKNISWVHIDLLLNHWTKNNFRNNALELEAYKKMDLTVFVSNQAKLSFKKLFGEEVPSKVILNLIERKRIRELSSESIAISKDHQYTICTVGRLTDQKRHDRMIKALSILVNRYNLDVGLWIIGQGENFSMLEELAHLSGVDDRVVFLGFKTNPYPYIKSADIFALSSDAEGYPLVICEALCLGKPIVSTDTTGPSELLADNVGILTGKDENSLAAGLAKLCQEPALLTEYSRRSIKKSMDFCPEEIMNEIYDIVN